MIRDLLFGMGLVAIVEGLVLALAPGRLQEILEMLGRLDVERRRLLGLLAVTIGVALVLIGRG